MNIKLVAPYKVKNTVSTTMDEVKEFVKSNLWLALDTETRPKAEWAHIPKAGLDPFLNETIMLQIGNTEIQYVIDVRFNDCSDVLSELTPKHRIYGVNLKFDLKQIHQLGKKTFPKLWDCMVNEILIKGNTPLKRGHFSLQAMIKKYLGIDIDSNQLELFPHAHVDKSIRTSFLTVKEDEPFTFKQILYGSWDVVYPIAIAKKQYKILKAKGLLRGAVLESSFTEVLAKVELAGMPFNKKDWLNLYTKIEPELEEVKKQLIEVADINWNSPKQILPVFAEAGISTILNKDGKIKQSISKNVLSSQTDHDLVKKYMLYKELSKKASTYGADWLKNVNPVTGNVHSSYFQLVNSGRMSSNSPNLQNIPARDPRWRECFNVEKGYVLVTADFSGQELRIAADKSKDEVMYDVFVNGDGDLHSQTARSAFQREILLDGDRAIGKTINFLTMYGGGAQKLSKDFGMSLAKARKLIKNFFVGYPKLTQYFSEAYNASLEEGHILINNRSKRKFIPPYQVEINRLKSLNHSLENIGFKSYSLERELGYLRSKLKRHSQNIPIQGTGADMTKYSAVLFYRKIQAPAQIVNIVHDEIVVKCREEDKEAVINTLEESMLESGKYFCPHIPMKVGYEISRKWNH